MNRHRYRKKNGDNFRWTNPRRDLVNIFTKEEHLSADEAYMKVKQKNPEIGVATVYRNLDFLTERGILNRFRFGDVKARYELRDLEKENHHHHLICESCGKIINYSEFVQREKKLINAMEKELSEKHGFQINSHQLHFYGICKDCRDK
ncbi:MAG: Fur family transcriptional regulator [Elusimicrobia bacterium]|jgi:Fur family ferric uptake transcriptional regulator|nr:Fur family transcriptional regulator [Elusimicrobiota bacterium]